MQGKIYTQTEAIALLSKATGMQFSREQLAVLNHEFNQPTLISASAGSGKTTIFILSVLVNVLTGRSEPSEILGVTFSKKAQEDMFRRYNKYVTFLREQGVDIYGSPSFTTFHALFYNLLKQLPEYRNVGVLSSYSKFQFELSDAIGEYSGSLSNGELLSSFFEFHTSLINKGVTFDGITIRKHKVPINEVPNAEIIYEHSREFLDNYVSVITRYNELKRQNNMVDFNDMKINTLQIMRTNSPSRNQLLQIMSAYKLAFIDEFQDIDDVQAFLLSLLLTPDTYGRLVAIGDEDQNIYSFRGSNAKHILNFDTNMPNAKVLPLSTNYRTGGNILDSASTIISNNVLRKDKNLKAHNTGIGKAFMFDQKDADFQFDSGFLADIKSVYQNKPEQTTAILVRFNIDRTIIADWLVGEGLKPNINNEYTILQKNTFYDAQVKLMQALWYNDFTLLKQVAKRIGFASYENYVRVVEIGAKVRFDTISEYLEHVDTFDGGLAGFKLKQAREYNRQISMAVDMLQNMRSQSIVNDDRVKEYLWNSATKLTKKYFKYMFDHHMMSRTTYIAVINYAHAVYAHAKTVNAYFASEEDKLYLLEQINGSSKKSNLEILSLHQSKGLEFDNVFLYGLTTEQIDPALYHAFLGYQPKIGENREKFEQFIINRFSDLLPTQQANTRAYVLSNVSDEVETFLRTSPDMLGLMFPLAPPLPESKKKVVLTKEPMPQTKSKSELWEELFDELHTMADTFFMTLEEERRLVYVGMTRARKYLAISGYGNKSSAILNEIAIEHRKVPIKRKVNLVIDKINEIKQAKKPENPSPLPF